MKEEGKRRTSEHKLLDEISSVLHQEAYLLRVSPFSLLNCRHIGGIWSEGAGW